MRKKNYKYKRRRWLVAKEEKVLTVDELLPEVLETVKIEYDIKDVIDDKYINRLTTRVFQEFKSLSKSETIKEDLVYVIENEVLKRYDKRAMKGSTSVSRDGYSKTIKDEDTFGEDIHVLADNYEKVGDWLYPTLKFL